MTDDGPVLYHFRMIKGVSKPNTFLRAALIICGAALIADTLFVLTRSSPNLGVMAPIMLGAPLLLCGIFLPAIKKGCLKSGLIRAGMFLLSLFYAVFTLIFCITTGLILAGSTSPGNGADVLIVLGGGIRGSSPTLTLKYRLDAAVEYLEANPDTIVIVSGGRGADEIVSEASVMRGYLAARGIDESRIITEDRSQSTEENFRFSGEIIRERFGNDARIVFVTTRFHVFRAERTAAKLGIAAEGIPAKGVWYITPNDYLRECAAITVYFLRGDI